MDDFSLAHSKYNCTYHIVFIPKYRRKAMFGELRREAGEILSKVCRNNTKEIVWRGEVLNLAVQRAKKPDMKPQNDAEDAEYASLSVRRTVLN